MIYILIVKKPFRSVGVFYELGSIIKDPTQIRFLKTKRKERKIIDVTEKNIVQYTELMESRTGKALKELYRKALDRATKEFEVNKAKIAEFEASKEAETNIEAIIELEKPKIKLEKTEHKDEVIVKLK